jgi:hypothetical protein
LPHNGHDATSLMRPANRTNPNHAMPLPAAHREWDLTFVPSARSYASTRTMDCSSPSSTGMPLGVPDPPGNQPPLTRQGADRLSCASEP